MDSIKTSVLLACLVLAVTPSCKEEGGDGDAGPTITCDRGEWGSNANIREELTLNETYSGYTHIGGSAIISGATFENFDPLICLQYVGRTLSINANPVLEDIGGLINITEIGGALNVQANTILTNIDGLSGVATIGTGTHEGIKYLQILDNPVLDNVDGLINLTSITDDLYIYQNDTLSNLAGLANLTSLGGDRLWILNNPMLPNCEAEELIERLQANGFSGEVMISGNDMTATCE